MAERARLGQAVLVCRGRAGERIEMFGDPVGGLDGSECCGFVPLFGDRAAAFVAGTAVVRRERLAHHERAPGGSRGEATCRDDLPGPVRRVPFQFHRGAPAFVFEEIEAQRVGAATDEPDGAGEFPKFTARHPAFNQLEIHVVHPKPDAVFAGDDKFVVAALLREHRTAPAHREFLSLVFLVVRSRSAAAVLEINGGVRALDAVFVPAMVPAVVVAGIEPSRLAKLRLAGETAYQIGDRVEMLPVGQARQLDAGWLVSQLGIGRVERVEDVAGHTLRFVPHALFRIVIRHSAGDDTREFFDRPVADQRLVVLIGDAFALIAVALGAEFRVKVFTGQLRLG